MLVSIIIPVYNSAEYVERCIRSIANQTWRDIELIIVDDCSKDNSLSLINSVLAENKWLAEKSTVVQNDVNHGSGFTRRRGQDLAHGDYLIYVDSDDYVSPDYIRLLAECALSVDADMVMCGFYCDYGEKLSERHIGEFSGRSDLVCKLLSGQFHNGLPFKLIRRSLLVDHDIHTSEGLNMFDDLSVSYKIAYFAREISVVDTPLYYYNRINTSSQTNLNPGRNISQAVFLIKQIDEFFSDKDTDELIERGITFRKIFILGLILLHGTKAERTENLALFPSFSLKDIYGNSRLPIHYKIAVMFNQWKLTPLCAVMRLLMNFSKK